jgi:hypothetical protein
VSCHLGPNDAAGKTQVVGHDLIAAGHPRLSFEFHAYCESLPAHWDRQADEARLPGAFHFRSWLAGQTAQIEQRTKLPGRDGQADFAQLDCFACHHQLVAKSWRQPSPAPLLQPMPWPSIALPAADIPVAARLELARTLFENSSSHPSWDSAVQSQLAARAMAADLSDLGDPQLARATAPLNSALRKLGRYLSCDCFPAPMRGGLNPTQYDAPTDFAPGPLNTQLQPVRDALLQLDSAITAASSR